MSAAEEDFDFPSLRGSSNYSEYKRWKINMEVLFCLIGVWGVVSGEVPEPVMPSVRDDGFEKAFNRYQKKANAYRHESRKAWAAISWHVEDEPLCYIRDEIGGRNAWKKLKKEYGRMSDVEIQNTFNALPKLRLSLCTSLDEYTSKFKTLLYDLKEMGYEVPSWILLFIYRGGLTAEYDDDVFRISRFAEAEGRKMTYEDLAMSFPEKVRRLNYSEDERYVASTAQAGNFGKHKKAGKSSSSRGREASGSRPSRPKVQCSHCNGKTHTRKRCYYLHPEKRPENWQPRYEYLLLEHA